MLQPPLPPSSPAHPSTDTSFPNARGSIATSNPTPPFDGLGDVLFPGDFVGEGGTLQGEPIRLFSAAYSPEVDDNSSDEDDAHQPPAAEFQIIRRLGTGSYAVVYLVREVLSRPSGSVSDDGVLGSLDEEPSHIHLGREYAIKCLSRVNLDAEARSAQEYEIHIHQSLPPHPNIVTLHRTLETPSFLLLLLEYVPGQDLFYFLEGNRDGDSFYDDDCTTFPFPSQGPSDSSSSDSSTQNPSSSPSSSNLSRTPPTPSLLATMDPSQLLTRTRLRLIASMFRQMCEAVEFCHSQQVFHRDIKPENFIVTEETLPSSSTYSLRSSRKVVVKLTDFGLSTTDEESGDMDCGSAPYMSYECRNNISLTYRPRSADVWSLGIVLINMLYHHNPWTDTAQGTCSSFEAFRLSPVPFFLKRFIGMTIPIASFLANKVFNLRDKQRCSAREFGVWVSEEMINLFLATPRVGISSSTRIFNGPFATARSHRIKASAGFSHRPSSRQASFSSRPSSVLPMFDERDESVNLDVSSTFGGESTMDGVSTIEGVATSIFDHVIEDEESTTSRSTSTSKRRKRGMRRGKGATSSTPTSFSASETMSTTLAVASQRLARELSKAKSAGTRSLAEKSVGSSAASTGSSSSVRRRQIPFEPVSMYGIPAEMCTTPSLTEGSIRSARALSSRSSEAAVSVISKKSLLSNTSNAVSPEARASAKVSVSLASISSPSAPQKVPTKKPSKWKLGFGKSTSGSAPSPIEESPPSSHPSSALRRGDPNKSATSLCSTSSSSGPAKSSAARTGIGSGGRASLPVASTATTVSNLLNGLNPAMPIQTPPSVLHRLSKENVKALPSSSSPTNTHKYDAVVPRPYGHNHSGNSRFDSLNHSTTSLDSLPIPLSVGPSSEARHGGDGGGASSLRNKVHDQHWATLSGASIDSDSSSSRMPRHASPYYSSESRATSPRRNGGNISSASSTVSSNWRSSTSSSSAFRSTNGSRNSVSTMATSVSGASSSSWRAGQVSPSGNTYVVMPKNIKLMDGVPREIDQLPRGQYPQIFSETQSPRKQRTRKGKDTKLDTITEKPGPSSPLAKSALRSSSARNDASTSTTDLGDREDDGPKKVAKGQINALAKMLSALRR